MSERMIAILVEEFERAGLSVRVEVPSDDELDDDGAGDSRYLRPAWGATVVASPGCVSSCPSNPEPHARHRRHQSAKLLPVTETAERFRRRADAFEALIEGVVPDRWASPSPCEGWMARDVVAHIVRFPTWEIPASVSERLRVEAALDPHGGAVVDDPLCGLRGFRDAVQRGLEDPASPAEVIEHIDQALSLALAEHWWDLDQAQAQD